MNLFFGNLFFVLSMWKLTLGYGIHKNVLLHVLHCENRSPKQDDDSLHCQPYQEIQIWLNGIHDGPWVTAWDGCHVR